eukprot:1973273-Prorocentrum_lima.AAC.1
MERRPPAMLRLGRLRRLSQRLTPSTSRSSSTRCHELTKHLPLTTKRLRLSTRTTTKRPKKPN